MKNIIIVLLILCPSLLRSQALLSLDSIFARIDQNSPVLKSYEAQAQSIRQTAQGARGWDAPLVSSGLWMAPYNPGRWKKQVDGSNGMGQYMLSAEQMFPSKKKQAAEEKYMTSMADVETENRNAARNEMFATAKTLYYQWVVLKKKMAVLDQNEKLLDFMIKNAELRYRNNLGKISAYYKAKASLGRLENMRLMLINEINQKRIGLNTLMNVRRDFQFETDSSLRPRPYPDPTDDSLLLQKQRSEIRALDRELMANSLQQQAENMRLRPEFGVRYDHMFGFGGSPMQYSLMGMVRLPLTHWASRSAKANIEGLKWKALSLEQQKQGIIQQATGQAAGLRAEISSKQKQLHLFESNILPALQKNYQTMQLAYEQNTEDLFNLFDAWETLNMTQLEYYDQLQQWLQLTVELERILEIK